MRHTEDVQEFACSILAVDSHESLSLPKGSSKKKYQCMRKLVSEQYLFVVRFQVLSSFAM
jgi:hypothetical protein